MSESARANSAAEYRYRLDAPNSRPRNASLVALDPESSGAVRAAVAAAPSRRRIVDVAPTGLVDLPAWLAGLPGQTHAIIDEATRADLVVMVARAGYRGDGASLLGEACRIHQASVTAIVVAPPDAPDEAIAATLARFRPFAGMLVVVTDPDYLTEMLDALRA